MKYNTALPYFPPDDINYINQEFKKLLCGEGLLTKGPRVLEFENKFAEYIGTNFGVSTNSCTSSLEISLKAIGISKDDEVIVPVQTFVSTGLAVNIAGGTPIFCEVDQNLLMDFNDLKNRITKKIKAVIIVHFAGLIHPEIFQIKKYLKERNIFLIEDAAHAHGAKIESTYAGNIGDFGCFSFYSTKIITTGGEGGIITLNNREKFDLCRSIRSIGIDVNSTTEQFSNVGNNNRMTEMQAIIGLTQLYRLEEFLDHRIKLAEIYKEKLYDLERRGIIRFQKYPQTIRHPFWRFLVFVENSKHSRGYIQDKMSADGIKIDWPYEPLMHLQPIYKRLYNTVEGMMPDSESVSKKHFCLPIHMGITKKDALFIADKLKSIFL